MKDFENKVKLILQYHLTPPVHHSSCSITWHHQSITCSSCSITWHNQSITCSSCHWLLALLVLFRTANCGMESRRSSPWTNWKRQLCSSVAALLISNRRCPRTPWYGVRGHDGCRYRPPEWSPELSIVVGTILLSLFPRFCMNTSIKCCGYEMMIRDDDTGWWYEMMIRDDKMRWWYYDIIWWYGMMIRNDDNTSLPVVDSSSSSRTNAWSLKRLFS